LSSSSSSSNLDGERGQRFDDDEDADEHEKSDGRPAPVSEVILGHA